MHLLWLASWYPDPYSPSNGDFVQRHARAVAFRVPLTVIHVVQGDPAVAQRGGGSSVTEKDGLREVIVDFPHHPTGFHLWDRINYDRAYDKALDDAIREQVDLKGKPDLIHVHVPMKAGKAAVQWKRKQGIPYVVSEHSAAYLEAAPEYFFRRSAYHKALTRRILRQANVVTNVSDAIGAVIRNFAGIDEVITIRNTVDTSLFNRPISAPDRVRLIHVSGLSAQKNITGLLQTLIRMAAVRQDWELVLVGPVSQEVRALVGSLRETIKVTCTGILPYPEVAREMKASSAFVLFSDYENFPCVNIEALCCGLPVITTDVGGAREAIHPSNGIVIPKGDEQALAIALDTLMKNLSAYDREAISTEAQSLYGYGPIGVQFIRLYERILGRPISS